MLGAQAHKCKDDEETKTAERSVECRGCGGFADPPSPSVSHTKKDPENRASSDYENFPTRREKRGGVTLLCYVMLCDAMKCYTKIAV